MVCREIAKIGARACNNWSLILDKNTRTWAMILHLSVLAGFVIPFAGLVAPILIWQLKKDEMPELDAHGKVVTNFLISMFIYGVVAGLLCIVLIGIPIVIALSVIGIVFPIVGGIKANDGVVWNYPLMIQFF